MPTPSGFPTFEERQEQQKRAFEEGKRAEQARQEKQKQELLAKQRRKKERLDQVAPELTLPVEVAEEFLRDSLGLKDARFGAVELAKFGEYSPRLRGNNNEPEEFVCRIYESNGWQHEGGDYHLSPMTDDIKTLMRLEQFDRLRRDRYTNRSHGVGSDSNNSAVWTNDLRMMAVCLTASGGIHIYAYGLNAAGNDFQLLAETMSQRSGKKVEVLVNYDSYSPARFIQAAYAPKTQVPEGLQPSFDWSIPIIGLIALTLVCVIVIGCWLII